MRALAELIDQQDPGLPLLRQWAAAVGNEGILRPPSDAIRADTLQHLQVTTRSMLGTIVYETGGVSVADGLVRLLGSGADRSLRQANRAAGRPLGGRYPDILLVADDALGGLFALNGGGFGADGKGMVFHLAADDTAWLSLDVGYTDFVRWCLTGDLAPLYGVFAWLEAYTRRPRPTFDSVYSFYPFLWTKEAKASRPDIRVIDANENIRLRIELCGFAVD